MLMPIRARTLRRPASRPSRRFAGRPRPGSGPRRRAAAGQLGRQLDGQPRRDRGGARPRGPSPAAWTSRTSAASTSEVGRGRAGRRRSARRGRRRRRGPTGSAADRSARRRSSRTRARRRPGRRRTAWRGEPVEGRAPGRPRPPPRTQVASSRRTRAGERVDRPSASATIGRPRPRLDRVGPRSRPGRRAAEQRRPPAQLDEQVHDDPFPLRVDRRVRDLGERLAQVVRDRPVRRPGRRRRVVAHGPERLVSLDRHRLDVQAELLGVEPGQAAQRGGRPSARPPVRRGRPARRRRRPRGRPRARRCCGARGRGPPPWPRRPRGSAGGAGRRGASRPGRAGRAGRSRPPERHAPASDATMTRPSARIATAAGRSPLRSRARPHGRPSPKTRAAGPSHGARRAAVRTPRLVGPGTRARRRSGASRDEREERGVERPAGGDEQLERLVERERVGAVRAEQRPGGQRDERRSRPETRSRRAAADLLAVAADRVDLAVVGEQPERLGEPPRRVGVRGVALVEQREGGIGDRVREIGVGGRQPVARRRAPCRRRSGWRTRRSRNPAGRPRERSARLAAGRARARSRTRARTGPRGARRWPAR